MASIQNDWRSFGVGQHVATSSAYAREKGKRVVELWGIGLDGNGTSSHTDQWLTLIRWFQEQGCYVIGGVPAGWLSTRRFHDARPGFGSVYAACDALSPWVVGRYSGVQAADAYADGNLKPELAWCGQHKIAYIPCVYPGTSFYNSNHAVKNVIPSQHGLLMWEQFVNLRRLSIKTCFISMFDEYNEATAIAKSAENSGFTCPESVAEALAVHRESRGTLKLTPDEVRRRLWEMDAALIQLKGEEQYAVQAHLASIRAGASPDAYAEVFADIAARRKDLEGKRGRFPACRAAQRATRRAM